MEKKLIFAKKVDKQILLINTAAALIYFSWWLMPDHAATPALYILLLFGEFYHVLMSALFWFTMWPAKQKETLFDESYHPTVDVFITVAGEPTDIVEETLKATLNMRYDNFKVYVLNDGLVGKKDNWHEIVRLAHSYGVSCITRRIGGGAKAGNINNALLQTHRDIIVIFDADMSPHEDFLEKTIPYFSDKRIGFVQTPQYYKNNLVNEITKGAWEQQEFFFGPIMEGKDRVNSAFMCGTNVVIRRKALVDAGGMRTDNIAEDFLTSLKIHQNGWISRYTREVLAEGLAPEDMQSYWKQQLRWARGSLEVLFWENPIFKRGLTWAQRFQYLSSALYYFNGLVLLIDMAMPILFLLTGRQVVSTSTTSFALFFLPFMFLNLSTLFAVASGRLTFRAISFSQSAWTLQLKAIKSAFLNQKMAFVVTPKKQKSGNFLFLAYPHFFYIFLMSVSTVFAVVTRGVDASIISNVAWGLFNIILFLPFLKAVVNPNLKPEKTSRKELSYA